MLQINKKKYIQKYINNSKQFQKRKKKWRFFYVRRPRYSEIKRAKVRRLIRRSIFGQLSLAKRLRLVKKRRRINTRKELKIYSKKWKKFNLGKLRITRKAFWFHNRTNKNLLGNHLNLLNKTQRKIYYRRLLVNYVTRSYDFTLKRLLKMYKKNEYIRIALCKLKRKNIIYLGKPRNKSWVGQLDVISRKKKSLRKNILYTLSLMLVPRLLSRTYAKKLKRRQQKIRNAHVAMRRYSVRKYKRFRLRTYYRKHRDKRLFKRKRRWVNIRTKRAPIVIKRINKTLKKRLRRLRRISKRTAHLLHSTEQIFKKNFLSLATTTLFPKKRFQNTKQLRYHLDWLKQFEKRLMLLGRKASNNPLSQKKLVSILKRKHITTFQLNYIQNRVKNINALEQHFSRQMTRVKQIHCLLQANLKKHKRKIQNVAKKTRKRCYKYKWIVRNFKKNRRLRKRHSHKLLFFPKGFSHYIINATKTRKTRRFKKWFFNSSRQIYFKRFYPKQKLRKFRVKQILQWHKYLLKQGLVKEIRQRLFNDRTTHKNKQNFSKINTNTFENALGSTLYNVGPRINTQRKEFHLNGKKAMKPVAKLKLKTHPLAKLKRNLRYFVKFKELQRKRKILLKTLKHFNKFFKKTRFTNRVLKQVRRGQSKLKQNTEHNIRRKLKIKHLSKHFKCKKIMLKREENEIKHRLGLKRHALNLLQSKTNVKSLLYLMFCIRQINKRKIKIIHAYLLKKFLLRKYRINLNKAFLLVADRIVRAKALNYLSLNNYIDEHIASNMHKRRTKRLIFRKAKYVVKHKTFNLAIHRLNVVTKENTSRYICKSVQSNAQALWSPITVSKKTFSTISFKELEFKNAWTSYYKHFKVSVSSSESGVTTRKPNENPTFLHNYFKNLFMLRFKNIEGEALESTKRIAIISIYVYTRKQRYASFYRRYKPKLTEWRLYNTLTGWKTGWKFKWLKQQTSKRWYWLHFLKYSVTFFMHAHNAISPAIKILELTANAKATRKYKNRRLLYKLSGLRKATFFDNMLRVLYLTGQYKNPYILAEHLSRELCLTKHHWKVIHKFRGFMNVFKLYSGVVSSIRIGIYGKINENTRKNYAFLKFGTVAPTTRNFYNSVKYSLVSAHARTGVFGIKVWLQNNNPAVQYVKPDSSVAIRNGLFTSRSFKIRRLTKTLHHRITHARVTTNNIVGLHTYPQ